MSIECEKLTNKLTAIVKGNANSIVQPVYHLGRHDGSRSKSDDSKEFFLLLVCFHGFGNCDFLFNVHL